MPFAQTNHLPQLPDGIYDIGIHSSSVQFLIHTVRTGTLAGRRIVKKMIDGHWKGFASLRVNNNGEFEGLYVWSSMRNTINNVYANSVAGSISSFISRARGVPEHTFIMIHDCPMMPREIHRNQSATSTEPATQPHAETSVAQRTTPLAMSAFNSTVVR